MIKIKTLGLLANPTKPDGLALGKRAIGACARFGICALPGPGIAQGGMQEITMETLRAEADALVVIGGDGTILRAVRDMGDTLLPILGVNSGTLGFLAECAPTNIERAIQGLAEGAYMLEQRMLLSAGINGSTAHYTALNDVVASRGHFSRTLRVDVHVDGSLATAYIGDGCIIASPTGSTAYALSSGGPIVSPDLRCIIITPICPHTLSSRTMVVPADAKIRLILRPREGDDGGIVLAVDGGKQCVFGDVAEITVQRGKQDLPFIRFGDELFFSLLRRKLTQWGEGGV